MSVFIIKGDWVSAGRPAPMTAVQAYQRGERLLDAMLPSWQRQQMSGVSLPKPLKGLVDGWATSDDAALAAFGAALQAEGSYTYVAFANQWAADNATNNNNNVWNWNLFFYLRAKERLAQYRLADGRPEVTDQVETGEVDPDTGEPITETVVTQAAVEPLPATIEKPTYDDTGAQTGVQDVANPLITTDDAERAAAQAIIDAAAQDIKEFADA